jgi:hypothetical protein
VTTGKPPRTDAWAGRDVVQIMTAIDRSVKASGAPVIVEQEEDCNDHSDDYAADGTVRRSLRAA